MIHLLTAAITVGHAVTQNASAISSADYFERDENGEPILNDSDLSAADLVNRMSFQVRIRLK